MQRTDIRYFHRYRQTLEAESIPGHRWLRFLYDTCAGRLLLKVFFKRAWFSKCIAWWMNTRFSKSNIRPFAEKYAIDLNEFEKQPQEYKSFNDFFYRKFKSEFRPICKNTDTLCFPCDGRHLGFQTIEDTQKFFIKGGTFNLQQLLKDETLAGHFRNGACVISRLAPVDYHRFHFPCDGIPQTTRLINGFLYSVSPVALKGSWRIFGENKRWLTILQSERFGKIALIEVGACCVGSVRQTFVPESFVKKGDEKGYFLFGGSTVITLFEPNRVVLAEDLVDCTQKGLELYAYMGDVMAKGTAKS